MTDSPHPPIADLLANRSLIQAAITKGVREALLKHAQAGNPVCTSRDGKVVWLSPEEVFALLKTFDEPKA
jgi:hypothetical protein